MCALMCRNVSALICLLLISSSKQKTSRSRITRLLLEHHTVKFIVLAIVIFSMGLYSFQLAQYKIVYVLVDFFNKNSTDMRWDIWLTDFGWTVHTHRFEVAASILRDCVNLLVLIVLNSLIVYKLKKSLRRKKKIIKLGAVNEAMSRSVKDEGFSQMATSKRIVVVASTAGAGGGGGGGGGGVGSMADETIRSIKRKENRQTLMMLLTCLNYLVGRIPLLYLFIKRNLFEDNSNFGIYAILIAYVSYTANFLFYYVSNNRFRLSVNLYLKRAFSFCSSKG